MSNQVPPGPGQPYYPGSEPPYGPYSSQAPGVPPPPGSYPQGGPQGVPPYGQPSEPSYGPPSGPPPSGPPYGPPSGQGQPSFGGYDPAGYGAGGYQPGQGQYPPQGGYAPSYGGGQYPGAPKGGSGGKIAAIVAAAVVVVGLVVGGVVLLTRDGGGSVAETTSADPSTSSAKPKPDPDPTTSRATPTPSPTGGLSYDQAQALAEAAFPAAPGNKVTFCNETDSNRYDSKISVSCSNDAGDFFYVLAWDDVASAQEGIRDEYYGDLQEVAWAGGTDYISPSYMYNVVRCYADAPVCLKVALVYSQEEVEAALGRFSYLDAAGITTLNDKLADEGV